MIAKNNYSYYLNTDLSEFKGLWVIIAKQKVVLSDKNPGKLLAKAKKIGIKQPLLTKVSDKETNLY